MDSCMVHLHCMPPRAAGVNFWFFNAVPSGGGCWYKAKCEIRDAVTQNRLQKERVKLWMFRKIAKWRRWRYAPRLTSMAVVTDSHRHFSMIWHVADIKKNRRRWPGNPNGQSKFRNIRLFTLTRSQLMLRRQLRQWVRGWRRLAKIAQRRRHCRHQTHCRRWPGNPNARSKFHNLLLPTSNASSAMTRQSKFHSLHLQDRN